MKFEITDQTENKLLNRKELKIKMESEDATPSNEEVIARVTAQLSVQKELVVIETISQSFGLNASEAYVKVYDNEDALKATEPKQKEKQDAKPSKVPDESGEIRVQVDDTPAEGEEKKEEAPKKEEKKEDKKEEAPKEEAKEEKAEEKKGDKK